MGELGKAFPHKPSAKVLEGLVSAYADEWFAHYNFQFVALTMRGHRAPALSDYLSQRSQNALKRANELATRLLELGKIPPAKLIELEDYASDKPFKLPRSLADADGILRAVLDAERTTLRTYQALHQMSANDPLTQKLVLRYWEEAVRNEEDLEKLLGDSVPHMRGT